MILTQLHWTRTSNVIDYRIMFFERAALCPKDCIDESQVLKHGAISAWGRYVPRPLIKGSERVGYARPVGTIHAAVFLHDTEIFSHAFYCVIVHLWCYVVDRYSD